MVIARMITGERPLRIGSPTPNVKVLENAKRKKVTLEVSDVLHIILGIKWPPMGGSGVSFTPINL